MKVTINVTEFIDRFHDYGRSNHFTNAGLRAMFATFEDIDPNMELDIVGICCDFAEYEDALSAALEYGFQNDEDASEANQERDAMNYLRDNTLVIEFDGGIIIQGF